LALREPAQASPNRSVGLLDDTLDLLARAGRGLSAVVPTEQVFEIASKSRPGEVNTVTVANGVARCSYTGFAYRGTCSHVKSIVVQISVPD